MAALEASGAGYYITIKIGYSGSRWIKPLPLTTETQLPMPKRRTKSPQVAPPAATGNAGPQFEAKVGAFYLLALLSGGEPRGLPGATINTVRFQQRVANHPLDDVIVQGTNADGSDAILEIQAKRSLTFTASDNEFSNVVDQNLAGCAKTRVYDSAL